MRVAVIGAGAVGGAIAALLHRDGHDVEVTARGAHLAAIRANGISLSGQWGNYCSEVAANPVLSSAPELAIVTTKTLDAEEALRQNAGLLAGVPVLIIQNGVTAITTARRVLPDSEIIGGLALFAASFLEPGHVAITTSGVTYLGSTPRGDADAQSTANGNDAPQPTLEFVAAVLGAVIPVRITTNFAGAQWTKLIVNQINALPAITNTSAQATIADRRLRRILTRSMQEAVGVGIDSGVRFEKMQGISHGLLRVFRRLPVGIAQVLPLFMKQKMGHIPNPGSTLQSIRRGQRSEIDYLNGAIVAAAKQSRTSAPINSTIVALVHEVEESGKVFSTEQVVDRINHPKNYS